MCLSSFFQFPFLLIACVEEVEVLNSTSSTPPEKLNAGSKHLPSPLLLLGCLILVSALLAPDVTAAPLPEAHHRHTRPWSRWHRTSHVKRTCATVLTTGAELPDVHEVYRAISANPLFDKDATSSHLRLPRNLVARTYEYWKDGKICSCVMRVLGAKTDGGSSK